MLLEDLTVEGNFLVHVETVRKGHTHQDRVKRVLKVDMTRVPAVLSLVQLFKALQAAQFDSGTTPTHFWQLPGEDLTVGTHFDSWFALCLELVPVAVPPGLKLHPHCVRKGAASAARAVGVTLERICRLGGWQLGSKAVWHYIDPLVQATKAAALLFGWLLPASVDSLLAE